MKLLVSILTVAAALSAATVNAQNCTLCADGANPSGGNLNEVLFFSNRFNGNQTCSTLAKNAPTVASSNRVCAGYQELGATYCGCKSRPKTTCNFCPDGSLSTAPPGPLASECAGKYVVGAAVENNTKNCFFWQLRGLGACGCRVPAQLEGRCPLCSDGSQYTANKSLEILPYTTCDGIAAITAVQIASGQATCNAFQTVGGYYCGCPNANLSTEKNTCRLCGDGVSLPETGKIVMLPDNSSKYCFEIEAAASSDVANCPMYRSVAAAQCCASSPPSPPPLTIAPTTCSARGRACTQPTNCCSRSCKGILGSSTCSPKATPKQMNGLSGVRGGAGGQGSMV